MNSHVGWGTGEDAAAMGLQLPLKLSSSYFLLTVSYPDDLSDDGSGDCSDSSFYLSPRSSSASSPARPAPAAKKRTGGFRFRWPFLFVAGRGTAPARGGAAAADDLEDGSSDTTRSNLEELLSLEPSGPEPKSKAAPGMSTHTALYRGGLSRMSSSSVECYHEAASSFWEDGSEDGGDGGVHASNDEQCESKVVSVEPAGGAGLRRAGSEEPVVVRMSFKKMMLIVKVELKLLKAVRRKLGCTGGGPTSVKEERLYDRRIPMGRRCRTQHLQATPY